MLLNLYYAAAVVSFICVAVVIFYGKNRHSYVFPMLFTAILLANFGYALTASAKSLDAALVAVKITYLGECYLQLFVLKAIADFCNISLPKHVSIILFAIATVVMGAVSTIGYSPIYYNTVELVSVHGITTLNKTYGPLHTLYLVMLVAEFVCQVVLVTRSFFMRKTVSFKTSICVVSLELANLLAYAITQILDTKIEMMPFSYFVTELILLGLTYNMDKYSVSENIVTHAKTSQAVGYISFDKHMNFIGANDAAKNFIVEIGECRIDRPIPDCFKKLQSMLLGPIQLMEKEQKDFTYNILYNEKNLKCTATRLVRLNKFYGFIIKVEDDTDQQRYVQLINNYNKELLGAVTEKTSRIQEMQKKMIYSVAEIIEERDEVTGGHIKRTSEGVRILAEEMQKYPEDYFVPVDFYDLTVQAAPLHDLGKIVVDDAILRKKGKLTDEEFTIIKMHPLKGAEIVEKVLRGIEEDEFTDTAKNIALYHHERWDGRGYPVGLSGEQIPLEARMMALADVTDALLSKRSYKDAMSYEQTFQILEESMGTQFDPQLGKIFLDCKDKIIAFYESQKQNLED